MADVPLPLAHWQLKTQFLLGQALQATAEYVILYGM